MTPPGAARKPGRSDGRLPPLMMLRLAAPQTWAASVIPCLLGSAMAHAAGAQFPVWLFLCLTGVCVLMQAAVNTFNDYSDFIRGTDTLENSPDAQEAVMLYDRPAPKKVLLLGVVFLLLAACLGVPAILLAGWRPLAVGAVGGLVVLLYSFGRKPLSHLPLGELVSGFVMGGLIPYAVYGVLMLDFSAAVLLRALPCMLGVALIMFSNNGCDLEKDRPAGRRTFALLLGRARSEALYRTALGLWALLPMTMLPPIGLAVYLAALLPSLPALAAQGRTGLDNARRGAVMSGIVSLNTLLGLAYAVALLF